jgi:hypothetical protein
VAEGEKEIKGKAVGEWAMEMGMEMGIEGKGKERKKV